MLCKTATRSSAATRTSRSSIYNLQHPSISRNDAPIGDMAVRHDLAVSGLPDASNSALTPLSTVRPVRLPRSRCGTIIQSQVSLGKHDESTTAPRDTRFLA